MEGLNERRIKGPQYVSLLSVPRSAAGSQAPVEAEALIEETLDARPLVLSHIRKALEATLAWIV